LAMSPVISGDHLGAATPLVASLWSSFSNDSSHVS
jgi:hypothetical protein